MDPELQGSLGVVLKGETSETLFPKSCYMFNAFLLKWRKDSWERITLREYLCTSIDHELETSDLLSTAGITFAKKERLKEPCDRI